MTDRAYRRPAEPMSRDLLDDLVEADELDRVVIIDEEPYDTWDLYRCGACGRYLIDFAELHGDVHAGLACRGCLDEAEEDEREQRSLERWAQFARR